MSEGADIEGASASRPFTVSSLDAALKARVEGGFTKIYVEAEISGWRQYPSGHAYFTLKDADAQISAVMFKWSLDRCRAREALKDGAKVLVYATATVYPQRGSLQLNVLAARLTGAGDLMQRYLDLKKKLEDEGLFDPSRRRRLPFLPRRIGLVTSPSGAVVHDMCRVLTRRFPAMEIRLFPAAVQGADAPPAIVRGIEYFNGCADWSADVLIVARGGGSFEDLYCFNDETLVRAVAASKIPVVSAVGHETDFTLCDFAADVRAGTPSIAAEIVVPVKEELVRKLDAAASSMASAARGRYETCAQRVDAAAETLSHSFGIRLVREESVLDRLAEKLPVLCERGLVAAESALGELATRLPVSCERGMAAAESSLKELSAKLGALSPFAVLDRGYSMTFDASGAVVVDAAKVASGTLLKTRLARGEIASVAQ